MERALNMVCSVPINVQSHPPHFPCSLKSQAHTPPQPMEALSPTLPLLIVCSWLLPICS